MTYTPKTVSYAPCLSEPKSKYTTNPAICLTLKNKTFLSSKQNHRDKVMTIFIRLLVTHTLNSFKNTDLKPIGDILPLFFRASCSIFAAENKRKDFQHSPLNMP